MKLVKGGMLEILWDQDLVSQRQWLRKTRDVEWSGWRTEKW